MKGKAKFQKVEVVFCLALLSSHELMGNFDECDQWFFKDSKEGELTQGDAKL